MELKPQGNLRMTFGSFCVCVCVCVCMCVCVQGDSEAAENQFDNSKSFLTCQNFSESFANLGLFD